MTASVASLEIGDRFAPEPPLVPGLPVLGSVIPFLRDPLSFFLRSYRDFGPVFRYRMPGRSAVALAGTAANELLSRGEAENLFSPGTFFDDFGAELGANAIIIGAHGEQHRALRRSFKNGMSRSVMEKRIDRSVALTERALRRIPRGRSTSVRAFCMHVVSDQLGQILANYDASDYYADVRRVMTTLLETTVLRRWPRLMLRSPIYLRSRRRLHELSEILLAKHRTPPTDPDDRDLIDDLVSVIEQGVLDRADAVMITLTPYFAGLDTVASTLAYLLYALHSEPHLVPPLVAEADTAFASGSLTPDSLRAMSLLQSVLLETMRLYPTTLMAIRRALTSFVFAGKQIKDGDELHFAVTVPHMLESVYRDPSRFDVDRYSKERSEHKKAGAYAPFGLGPHTCLGAGFAQAQIMATVATMLRVSELAIAPHDYALRQRFVPLPTPVGMGLKIARFR